jgi:predicted nucleic acid-binding protein
MRIESIVANASPLICLCKSEMADLLPAMFSEIVVPDRVIEEIRAGVGSDPTAAILLQYPWIKRVETVTIPAAITAWDLGEGESAVMAYSLANPRFWAVIDDHQARRCADCVGCRHIGTVGVILLAKNRGVIHSVGEALESLKRAGLWPSEPLVNEIRRKAGEL